MEEPSGAGLDALAQGIEVVASDAGRTQGIFLAGHTHVWTLGSLSSVVLIVTSDWKTTLTADIHHPEVSTSVAGSAT